MQFAYIIKNNYLCFVNKNLNTMSKVNALFHVVINTKNRQMTIPMENREHLYKYIAGIVRNKGSKLIAINGIGNHVHILLDLNPTTALSDLVKVMKRSTSVWMKGNPLFPNFKSWGREYFGFSVSFTSKNNVIGYIVNQERHHLGSTFENEMYKIVTALGEEWHDYLLT